MHVKCRTAVLEWDPEVRSYAILVPAETETAVFVVLSVAA
jgi:hypothetical protein